MKLKIAIISAVILMLYFAKRKKDKAKEDKKLQAALAENTMSATDQLDIIRLKIEDFLKLNFNFMSEEERTFWVVDLTSNLEEYKQKYLDPSK